MKKHCILLLEERGVTLEDIAQCVLFLQQKYVKDLTIERAIFYVDAILDKREVQHSILTGLALDKLAEKQLIDDPYLSKIICSDAPLYGVDEVLAYGICNLYGSIALTNYGYIDKVKPYIIGKLNDHSLTQVNTFLDDIVGAIAASAAGKLAHGNDNTEDKHD